MPAKFRYFLLLFLLAAVQVTPRCKSINPFKAPKFNLNSVQFENVDFSGLQLQLTLLIDNPNFIGLTINRFSYELFIDDEKLAEGTKLKKTIIPGHKVTTIKVPLEIRFSGMSETLIGILSQDELVYKIKGLVVLDSPVGEINFDLTDYDFHQGTIPLPKLPQLTVKEVNVKKFSFTTSELELWLQINNQNPFDLKIKEMSFVFYINSMAVTESTLEDIDFLKPQSVSDVRIPIKLKILNLKLGLLQALKQRAVNYKLTSNLIIKDGEEEIVLPLKESGSIELNKE